MEIPYSNLHSKLNKDIDKILDLVKDVATNGNFILKERVNSLEKKMSNYIGCKHAIAVSDESAAILLLLTAMGVKKGVDVLMPTFSSISSANSVIFLNGNPIFVDVDSKKCVIDTLDLEHKITKSSTVVIPKHLSSSLADMERILYIAKKHNLFVLEDSTLAIGSVCKGKLAGNIGDAGVFNLSPNHSYIGSIGEGALIVTNNDDIAQKCRMLRNHGQDGKTRFLHHYLGFNKRMDEITAGYLLDQLNQLDHIINRSFEIANKYNKALKKLNSRLIVPVKDEGRLYSTYVVHVENREELTSYLIEKGIETNCPYRSMHLEKVFSNLGYKIGDLPNAEIASKTALALPIYPEMTEDQVSLVIETIKDFYRFFEEGSFYKEMKMIRK